MWFSKTKISGSSGINKPVTKEKHSEFKKDQIKTKRMQATLGNNILIRQGQTSYD